MRRGFFSTLLFMTALGLAPSGSAIAQDGLKKPNPVKRLVPVRVSPLKGDPTLKRGIHRLETVLPLERIANARIPASVRESVLALASDTYAQRQEASASLRTSLVPDEVLMAVLDREELNPEQRHRLLRVLDWRIRNRPRGAVGIRMSPGRDGVLINELVPGLPAEDVLRVGDTIVSINEFQVRENSDLVGVVQRLAPGTKIRMTVLRATGQGAPDDPPERIDVEFPLGSYAKLGNEPDVLGLSNPETSRRDALMQAVEVRYGLHPRLLEGQLATESGVIHGDG